MAHVRKPSNKYSNDFRIIKKINQGDGRMAIIEKLFSQKYCLAPREMWSGEDLAVQLMAARMDLENTGQDYLAKIVKGMKKPEA